MTFDPNSTDSMFSKILSEIEGHGALLEKIHEEVKHTNGRVTSLETDKKVSKAQGKLLMTIAGVAGGAVSFVVNIAASYFLK